MRTSATLSLLLFVGCGRPAVPDSASDTTNASPAAMTDAQRQATEDSVKAWLALNKDHGERGDIAGMMSMYPTTGTVVSATDGRLLTDRDSLAASGEMLTQVKGGKLTYHDTKVEILAPGIAAVTALNQFQGTYEGKAFDSRGVMSVVLAQRDGRMRVIQEHSSTAPSTEK